MKARPYGFDLVFTKPVDRESAANLSSYVMNSHTYLYHSTYGSEEIQKRRHELQKADVSQDGRTVRLHVSNLRPLFVHELVASGVRSSKGELLLHPEAWYTLNRIPAE